MSTTELPRHAFFRAKIVNAVSGATGPMAFSLLNGIILTKYVLDLGIEKEKLGIIHTVITLAVILQFFGAFIVEKTGKKRNTFLLFGTLRWIPVLFIFFLPHIPARFRISVLIIIYFSRGLMAHICAAAWNTMMNDIVPGNRRARFWSVRMILANCSAAGGIFVFSRVIDLFKSTGDTFTGYHITFVSAFVLGIIDSLIHVILPEKEIPEEERQSIRLLGEIKETCRSVLSDTRMKTFLVYYSLLVFQANLLMLTYRVYTLDEKFLNIPLGTMGTYTSMILGLSVGGYYLWGRIGDQFGYKIPIMFNLIMRFGIILPWIFMTPDNCSSLVWIWIITGGLFNVGLFLNTTSTMHAVVPERRRAHHMAFLFVVPTLCGSLAGGFFYGAVRILKDTQIVIFSVDFSDIKLIFLFVLILNFLIIAAAANLKETHGMAASQMLKGFFYRPGGFRTFWNVMAAGCNIGEDQMILHTKKMGAMENPIAVDQLIRGLRDPSFRVRQESAWGLGRISEEEGRKALEHVLTSPDSMIHDEAVWSLGKIGNEESVDVLLDFLSSDDAGFRARVVLALGEIRSAKAAGPLVEMLDTEENEFVRECIFDSLSILEHPDVLPRLIRSLAEQTSLLSRRHLAMSAGVYIDGKKDEFYRIFTEEIENRGALGNAVSRKIYSALRKLSEEQCLSDAKMLGDLFWESAYADVIEKVLNMYEHLSDRQGSNDMCAAVLHSIRSIGRDRKSVV